MYKPCVCITWRKDIRWVWGLPCDTHCDLLHVLCNALPVFDVLCKRAMSFLNACINSACNIVSYMSKYAISHRLMRSLLGHNHNALYCRLKCDVGISTMSSLIPMTHAPETGTENLLHFSGASFWYGSYPCLGPDSSGTRNRRRIEHCPILKPETGMHMTEMMICHCLLFIFVISCKYGVKSLAVICLFTVIHHLRRLSPIFIFSAINFHPRRICSTKNRCRKPAPEIGVNLWCRFLEHVPWVFGVIICQVLHLNW